MKCYDLEYHIYIIRHHHCILPLYVAGTVVTFGVSDTGPYMSCVKLIQWFPGTWRT